jgi:hypothetical protein
MVAGGASGVFAAAPAALTGIILLTGADETQRTVSWYSSDSTSQWVQVGRADQFPDRAVNYPALVVMNTTTDASFGAFSGHAVLSGLKQKTEYAYRVCDDGGCSKSYSFKTRDFHGDFDFLFFGDPQIGSSGGVPQDQAGWQATLDVALAANPNAELLVSAGDQVETGGSEAQWTAFLAPDQLRQYPWVATIGNHDVGSRAYEQHFWTPNTDRSHVLYTAMTASGGDYWFMYKNVLFIDLNSNAYTNVGAGDADQAHVAYVTDVVRQHGKEADFTVLVYHHAIYSPANHANDADNKKRRVDFPTAFSHLGVDLVLQGHDHSWSRSYEIKNGAKANAGEQPGDYEVAMSPGGVIYVTGNSASGSKYYDLSTPIPGSDFGPDSLKPEHHWANSTENQEHVRTYVKVSVRKDNLIVENIRSGTCAAPNAAFERGNVTWCGPDKGASPAMPVGSTADKVTIKLTKDKIKSKKDIVKALEDQAKDHEKCDKDNEKGDR